MDPQAVAELAQKIGAFLLPFLPFLLKAGEKAAEEAGEKLGGAAWERARALWERLHGKERVKTAAEAAEKLPDNPAVQQALGNEVARALNEDPALSAAVAEMLKDEVVQRVIATGKSQIERVEQGAHGGPTEQAVEAEEESIIRDVRQIRG